MGPAPRSATQPVGVVLVAAALLMAGCGGSLADADAPGPDPSRNAPPGDFCTAVLAGAEATRPLAALVARGGTVPRTQLTDAAARVRSANADVLATAPEEIRTDVERSMAAVELQLDALDAAGGDTDVVARDSAVRAALAEPEYTAATHRVRRYVDTHCGTDGG